jgi:hypothetical protein
MTEQQPGSSPVTPATPQQGIFGTKIPSSVAFGIGVLLFFMPFIDIKCNTMTLQTVSGVQLATGFEIKGGSDNSLFGGLEKLDNDVKVNTREKKDPNLFALAALGLGVISFVLALVNSKGSMTIGVISGTLSVAALIGTLIDIKKQLKLDLPEINNRAKDSGGLDRFGDGIYIAVDFTPWFYIAVIAFALGAWFCYKRIQVR